MHCIKTPAVKSWQAMSLIHHHVDVAFVIEVTNNTKNIKQSCDEGLLGNLCTLINNREM